MADIKQGINFIPQGRTANGSQIVTVYIIIGLVGVGLLTCILCSLTKSPGPSENDPLDSLSDEDEKKEREGLLNNETENDDMETTLTEN